MIPNSDSGLASPRNVFCYIFPKIKQVCLTDGLARIFLPSFAVAGIRTRICRVAATWNVCKDNLQTEPLRFNKPSNLKLLIRISLAQWNGQLNPVDSDIGGFVQNKIRPTCEQIVFAKKIFLSSSKHRCGKVTKDKFLQPTKAPRKQLH